MKKSFLLILTSVLVPQLASATPSIYPKSLTFLSRIQNPTTSNLVADDADSEVIWVMPPNSATSKVQGLHTITANVGYCQEMANLQEYSRDMSLEVRKLKAKESESGERVEALARKLSDARQDLSKFIAQSNLIDVQNLDDRLALVEAEIASLNNKLEVCEQSCRELMVQVRELRLERQNLVHDRRRMVQSRASDIRQMERKKMAVQGFEKDLEDLDARWLRARKNLEETRKIFNEMFADFGKLEGARAAIAYESGWDENVSELARLNPGYDFKRIHTKNAVVMSSLVNAGEVPGGGAVLSYDIGGEYSNGKITFPSYPQSLSGNVRLSLIGTCPVLHPELFQVTLPNGSDQMKYGMTIAYEFPSTFEVDVTARYNMYKLYQKVAKSGSQGGFLRSRRWNSIEEKTFFRDEFRVEWEEQDTENSLTEEQKADYEKEIRDNVFGRLAAIGLPSVTDPGLLVTPAAQPTGAAVLASALSKNPACQVNKFCVAASIGINVLDAILGSSATSSRYTNIQDVEMLERWSRKQVVYKPWISSYR